MSVPRYSAGVLALDGKGYAFGGYCAREALVTCEQFTLSREWDILSCMQYPRHSFSPVPYKKKVYLPDISKVHGFMEIFTPAKNKFRLASISPKVWEQCIPYSIDDFLLILHTCELSVKIFLAIPDYVNGLDIHFLCFY